MRRRDSSMAVSRFWSSIRCSRSGDIHLVWACLDSNQGPTDYEPAALTAELQAPNVNPKSQAPNPKSKTLGVGIWDLGLGVYLEARLRATLQKGLELTRTR